MEGAGRSNSEISKERAKNPADQQPIAHQDTESLLLRDCQGQSFPEEVAAPATPQQTLLIPTPSLQTSSSWGGGMHLYLKPFTFQLSWGGGGGDTARTLRINSGSISQGITCPLSTLDRSGRNLQET